MKMPYKPYITVLYINCFIYYICYADINAGECQTYETHYHIEQGCECVRFEGDSKSLGSHGVFTSPNYPEIYPSNVNCILYTFVGDIGEIVELTFLQFDTETPNKQTGKCEDYLRFFVDLERPEINEYDEWQYDLCGDITKIQKKHYSSGRTLIFEFHTDKNQFNNTGFKGQFRFYNKSEFAITGGESRWGGDCIYDFKSQKYKKGQFFSQRYPQNYPRNTYCQYLFMGDKSEIVKVTFDNIQLEPIDGSCYDSPDAIIVRDGPDRYSKVIEQFCNTQNDKTVVSTGPNMFIEFRSNEIKEKQGFAARHEFMNNHKKRPKPSKPRPSEPEINPQDGPTKTTTPKSVSRYLPAVDCDVTINSNAQKEGYFESPGYPNPYPESVDCTYTFEGAGIERVQISFPDFDLHYPQGDPMDPYDCADVDNVKVLVGPDDTNDLVGEYCGKKRPDVLMSSGSQMTVMFHSTDRENSSPGFKGKFRFVQDFGIKTGQQSDDYVCIFDFHSKELQAGRFSSPNFPGLYPRNTECHYRFYGEDNERVKITFPYFDVEGIYPGCREASQSDYVEFSNFESLKDRKMDRLCGDLEEDSAPFEQYSDGKFFRVTFKSNHIYDKTGFEGYFQFTQANAPKTNTSTQDTSSADRTSSVIYWTLISSLLTLVAS